MTPQEILNKKFERGMGGYKVEDVNAFLIEVSDYVADLQDERAELLEKMEIIAEKLEEYRADEDSLRQALLGAQKLGDSVVRDSKKKADAIVADAEARADALLIEARHSLNAETQALSQMQREVSKFRTQILGMYESQIQMIRTLPQADLSPMTAPVPAATAASPIAAAVAAAQTPAGAAAPESKADVFQLKIDETEDSLAHLEEEPAAAGQNTPKKKGKYMDLQFGEKYNLKRED